MKSEIKSFLVVVNFILIFIWGGIFLFEEPRIPVVKIMTDGNGSHFFAYTERRDSIFEIVCGKFRGRK